MQDQNMRTVIETLIDSKNCIMRAMSDGDFIRSVASAADMISLAIREGNKVMLIGNGGSAADSQHIAAELIGRFKLERNPLPAVALTTDTSTLTALANDYGFDQVFARQVQAIGKPGDMLVAISTSGRSPNIIAAMVAARGIGIKVIAMTGISDSEMLAHADLAIRVPDSRTPYIQQMHMIVGHAICDMVENAMTGQRRV